MHDAPIYDQLITERGDIPLQVRSEARRLQSELGWIAEAEPPPAGRPTRSPTAPAPVSSPNSTPQSPSPQADAQQGWFA